MEMETSKVSVSIGMQFADRMVKQLRDGTKMMTRRDAFSGSPGDTIYCRETFRPAAYRNGQILIDYKADWGDPDLPKDRLGKHGEPNPLPIRDELLSEDAREGLMEKLYGDRRSQWLSSQVMPQAAARIFCTVGSVRRERIQEITEADASQEGFGSVQEFREFWEFIYGAKAWAQNPVVCVIRFSTVQVRW